MCWHVYSSSCCSFYDVHVVVACCSLLYDDYYYYYYYRIAIWHSPMNFLYYEKGLAYQMAASLVRVGETVSAQALFCCFVFFCVARLLR